MEDVVIVGGIILVVWLLKRRAAANAAGPSMEIPTGAGVSSATLTSTPNADAMP